MQRVEIFDVTAVAGTAKSSPSVQDISFNQGEVTGIEIIIADGHAGFTGIALGQGGQSIVPYTPGAFISGNDEPVKWAVQGYLDNGDWQATVFNTDVYDHSWQVRFLVDNLGDQAAVPMTQGQAVAVASQVAVMGASAAAALPAAAGLPAAGVV